MDCADSRGASDRGDSVMLTALVHRLRSALAERRVPPMRVVAAQALHHGVVMYAVDVDGRRLILAASASGATLLSQYAAPSPHAVKEPASHVV